MLSRNSKIGINVLALVISGFVSGCVSSNPKMEPASVSKRLGVPGCKVSVPMSQNEVLVSAREWGDPNPETRSDWAAMLAASEPADEFRLVDCIKANKTGMAVGYYYYALFRGQTIIARMPGAIIN